MSTGSRPKQKRTKRVRHAYFIRRKSDVDDTMFFNNEGRRVYFDKVSQARPLLANIRSDQKPNIVYGPIQPGDMTWSEMLRDVLPAGVTPKEYLDAMEKTAARNMRAGAGR